jgi:hypothetical protein
MDQLSDAELQQTFGPNYRHQIFPGRRRAQGDWEIHEDLTGEPGEFQTRLDFYHPANLLIPTSTQSLNSRQLFNLWGRDRWDSIQAFTAALNNYLRGSETIYGRARIYLVRENLRLQIVEEYGGATAYTGNVNFRRFFNLLGTSSWQPAMQESLARVLMELVEEYYDELNDPALRSLNNIRIYVDLAPANLSGGVRKVLEESIKHYGSNVIWSPSSNLCFFKCLRKVTTKPLLQIQALFGGDFQDFTDYKVLFEKTLSSFPDYSLRLYSLNGDLRERMDGTTFVDKIAYLAITENHWVIITDIKRFIEISNGSLFYCDHCDHQELVEPEEHFCSDLPQCDRCAMIFQNSLSKNEHSHYSKNDLVCSFCQGKGFFNEDCFDHHYSVCAARPILELEKKSRDQLRRIVDPAKEQAKDKKWDDKRGYRYRPNRNV